ncbi:MAG: hypothetical protein KAR06_04780 [Deltaproteobacteria bacterium]|nr:hypothetical protein [Deltaproteobacteria bacterium]
MLIAEIRANYKIQHDNLSDPFYTKKRNGGVTAQEQTTFNNAHKQIWEACAAEIKTASDYVEPTPPRDLAKEIDDLKAEMKELKK